MKKRIWLNAILLVITLFIVELYISNNILEISNHEIYIENLPESFEDYKILQLSDLHSKEFGEKNSELINKIYEVNPDVIFITGDMVNNTDTNMEIFLEILPQISPKYETYFIVGNHELDLKQEYYNQIIEALNKNKVKFLNNEFITINKNNEKINIYGLWYNLKYYSQEELTLEIIEKIIGKDTDETIDILLTHNPKHFELFKEWGAEVIFTGHVHGGMVRLPIIGGLISPERKFFPEYDSRNIHTRGQLHGCKPWPSEVELEDLDF